MKQEVASSAEANHTAARRSITVAPVAPKYLTARSAAHVYGVHRDFFRKTPDIRRYRVVLNARTHLYPVDKLDEFFNRRRVD